MSETLLAVRELRVYYWTERGPLRAVDGVTFTLRPGERFGIVGESGCGKSTLAAALLRVLRPPGRIESGEVWLNGVELTGLSEAAMRRYRWRELSLIPQGAMNSLNPVMRIFDQLADAIWTHEGRGVTQAEVRRRVEELLAMVGLSRRVADLYPHQLSGGMKQRVCIAMAIALRPRLIIADEPTSALDVIVQRVVAQTLVRVVEEVGASLILIGHDMGLQAQLVDRLAIMYAGRLVEIGTVEEIFDRPQHPYTRLLIESLPSLEERRLPRGIPGLPPSLLHPPPGCAFHLRCPHAMEVCRQEPPELREVQPGRLVSCHLY
jgi:peptide/nickel transport system ATP-binding protein